MRETCDNTIGTRWPDVPVDQWEAATCIQEHDPTTPGTIHDSGDGTAWVEIDAFRTHAILELRDTRDTLKALRETLCVVQSALAWEYNGMDEDTKPPHAERIDRLIAEIDRQRPLSSGGKHGNLHTATCGCGL